MTTRIEVRKMIRIGQKTIAPAIFAFLLLLAVASVAPSQHPSETTRSTPNVLPPDELGGNIARGLLTSGPAALVGAAGEIIGFTHADASGTQTITLLHTGKSWMAVYHIDRSGTLRLVSSRAIDADFSLQLNATSPLPEEIRKVGKTR